MIEEGNLPPIAEYATQPGWSRDADHLRLLSIFHYIFGGLTMLLSSFSLIYIIIGVILLNNPNWLQQMSPPPAALPPGAATMPVLPTPDFFAWFFIGIGTTFLTIGWTVGLLSIFSGRCIAGRRRKVFSMVVAGMNCVIVPLGTVLGVFTFIVLQRQSMNALYGQTVRRR